MNINMGLGYTRELSSLQQFIYDNGETIQEPDALYIIGWARWMKDIVNGMPVGVEKLKCDESDDDVDEISEDDDDCLEPQKRTTPPKRKGWSQEQDAGDDRDDRSNSTSGGGNKPFKPPRSLDAFLNRVKGATTAKPKPKAASKNK